MASHSEQLLAAAIWNEERADEAKAAGDLRTAHRMLAQAEALRLLVGLELKRRRAAG